MSGDADDLRRLSAVQIAEGVNAGGLDARDVALAHLQAAAAAKNLNAYITLTTDRALRRSHRAHGPLAGVPMAVKDLLEIRGTRTTFGSRLFADHISTYTATVVQRLERAGAILIGKANLHEFAWGLTSQNEHWGDVANPTFPGFTPGGSSGGSAAAVAAHMATIGVGTDTGGSVRVPAAACRLIGFKPRQGSVPMRGVLPLAPSFDTVGTICRSVDDCRLVASVMSGRDLLILPVRGLRVGILGEGVPSPVLAEVGLRSEALQLPQAASDPSTIFIAECAFTHRDTFPRHRMKYGRAARKKWSAARRIRAVDFLLAKEALAEWRRQVDGMRFDVLVSRVLGLPLPAADVDEASIRREFGRYARVANFLGWASLAYGDLMISGPNESVVMSIGLALERAGVPLPEPIFDRV